VTKSLIGIVIQHRNRQIDFYFNMFLVYSLFLSRINFGGLEERRGKDKGVNDCVQVQLCMRERERGEERERERK
jgi:hypothetical protein